MHSGIEWQSITIKARISLIDNLHGTKRNTLSKLATFIWIHPWMHSCCSFHPLVLNVAFTKTSSLGKRKYISFNTCLEEEDHKVKIEEERERKRSKRCLEPRSTRIGGWLAKRITFHFLFIFFSSFFSFLLRLTFQFFLFLSSSHHTCKCPPDMNYKQQAVTKLERLKDSLVSPLKAE